MTSTYLIIFHNVTSYYLITFQNVTSTYLITFHNVTSSQPTLRYWYNIVSTTFHVYVAFRQKTCIFNRPKGICTAGQYRLFFWPVHTSCEAKPEQLLSAEQMRSLAEVRDAVSGPTHLFLLNVVTDIIRILSFH